MTEITEHDSKLSPAATEFILHWGNLGGQWGVNRSVAQIHALLFISDRALHAEEIAEMLGLARSNVSNSIKELLGWRLIERVPLLGDRRDHFTAEKDIWEMVTRIAAGRKAREVDPAEAALKACVARAANDPGLSPDAKARLSDMLDFVTTMGRWHGEMLSVPKPALMRLIRLGAGVTKLINWRPGKGKDAGQER
ncbi:ArsR family transcriptional regulator [Sphingopyxis sp. H038]|uniref:GbsR/MarR family transcriptional regulator n=1 Tax=unclassified Sphingopyxis TaxID=2614943 RepID=UPI00073090E0|nr:MULTISPECIES: MarR family transcriptional regulator [unclassified Sphingopyxis]KTE00291.1 ArsR family transcriptional regulator [Sphingopyxis sp. H012]KTE06458.1 ArsR family transcriptional regulator [Sphingopyxis sp. H053]KTE07279.1 ArsR family transcriptional regulator [Sphingopyxis sp. H093]KTE28846.1 ArsR family transcriptional regulator [Sphingopyxis sp. H080]KTE29323.1 ArsR family transcriptional regulator [Sphingopyxis sp. H038]